jgi:hypothetical protein
VRLRIHEDIGTIKNCFAAADERLKRAATIEDRSQAEEERHEAMGDLFAAKQELADLFILLLRHAAEHRPTALRIYLADLLREDFGSLAQAIAQVEACRK